MAAGAIITSNSQVGPSTIAGGRDGLKLGGRVDNIIDGTVSNFDLARKSVSLDKLAPGIAGPSASGRVDALGHVLQSGGQPVVTRQSKGDYCISVPGRSPVISTIVVSPDLEHDGTRQTGLSEGHSTVVETDGACAGILDDGHGFRVRTFD